MYNFFITLLVVLHFVVGIFIIILVLMQRTKEGGMGSAFGAGMTESLFGASSGNVLSKTTVWCACIFFATSLTMAIMFSHKPKTEVDIPKVTLPKVVESPIPSNGTNTAPATGTMETGGTQSALPSNGTLSVPVTPEKEAAPTPSVVEPKATPTPAATLSEPKSSTPQSSEPKPSP